jgi:hypothetical protein
MLRCKSGRCGDVGSDDGKGAVVRRLALVRTGGNPFCEIGFRWRLEGSVVEILGEEGEVNEDKVGRKVLDRRVSQSGFDKEQQKGLTVWKGS